MARDQDTVGFLGKVEIALIPVNKYGDKLTDGHAFITYTISLSGSLSDIMAKLESLKG